MGCCCSKKEQSGEDEVLIPLDKYKDMFQQCDQDKDGKIEEEEMFKFLQEHKYKIERQQVHDAIETFDEEKKGYMNEEQFIDFMKRMF